MMRSNKIQAPLRTSQKPWSTPYRLIDLFSGAGGLSLGFHSHPSSGFKSVLALDHDAAAIRSYCARFGDHGICTDIEAWLKKNKVPDAEIVVGGPPCQGFSLLNKNRQGDARRALWEPYMDIVARSGARAFVMENVPGLLKSTEFSAITLRAEQMGFQVVAAILNAADYGTPQVRKRAIVLGVRSSEPLPFPPPKSHASPQKESELPPWKPVGEVIDDLKPPVGTEIRNVPPPYNLHFGRNPSPLSRKRYALIPPGGNRFDLQRLAPELTPPCWLRKPRGGTDLFGRLWRDRPSVTIRTEFFKPEKGRYLHPEQDRPITHREAARLMGFPDDFPFQGSKAEIARQIGNAVPIPLAQAIADTVWQVLKLD